MDDQLLLVKGITLACMESQMENPELSVDLYKQTMAAITLPETNMTLDEVSKTKCGLMEILRNIGSEGATVDTQNVLQQVRVVTGNSNNLYEAIRDGISGDLQSDAVKKTCVQLRRSLRDHFREQDAIKIVADALHKMRFKRHEISNFKRFLGQMVAGVEPYTTDLVELDPAIVSDVCFGDIAGMTKVYESIKQDASGESVMRCGYQGINRMLRGGFRRGDQVVIGALQHNFKTGFSLSLFMQMCMYNVPHMINPEKKPLMVRFSFEDDISLNMRFVYGRLKEMENGHPLTDDELSAVDSNDIAEYVQKNLTQTGYHVKMLRVDPTKWSYMDLINKLLMYEAEGYEIHCCMVDYLYMLPTTGCTQGPAGHDVRDLYRRVRNWTNSRKICFITPHQLSTDAKQMIRDGKADFVKELIGKGYYAGSKQIDQEVDIELFIHIEKMSNKSWLTIQRGKHRIVGQTPIEDQYCAYQFAQMGTIPDDVNGPDQSRRKIGGGAVGSDDEIPDWEIQDRPKVHNPF
jgi:hypothetical protein